MNTVSTERLVADAKVLMGDAEELLKATAAQTGDKIVEARSRTQQALANARQSLVGAERAVVEQAKAAAQAVDRSVHERPWAAVGLSAAVGLLIGLLVGRR